MHFFQSMQKETGSSNCSIYEDLATLKRNEILIAGNYTYKQKFWASDL